MTVWTKTIYQTEPQIHRKSRQITNEKAETVMASLPVLTNPGQEGFTVEVCKMLTYEFQFLPTCVKQS